jgi:hypothetical protein
MKQPDNSLYRLLDSVGNGAGTKAMNTTADKYFLTPGATEIFVIQRVIFSYSDTKNWEDDYFAKFGAALTNGIKICVENATPAVVLDFLDGVPIKANRDFGRLCYDYTVQDYGVTTDHSMAVRWTLLKDLGEPLILEGSRTHRLVVETQDDMSGLSSMYVSARGYKVADWVY